MAIKINKAPSRYSPRSSPLAGTAAGVNAWLAAVDADDQPELQSFTTGIRQDYAGVRNGLTLPWSSGQVEGLNTHTKLLKRQMYGRAAGLVDEVIALSGLGPPRGARPVVSRACAVELPRHHYWPSGSLPGRSALILQHGAQGAAADLKEYRIVFGVGQEHDREVQCPACGPQPQGVADPAACRPPPGRPTRSRHGSRREQHPGHRQVAGRVAGGDVAEVDHAADLALVYQDVRRVQVAVQPHGGPS